MKKVLIYCPVFYPKTGGYAHAFSHLVSALVQYGSDLKVDVLTPQPLGDAEEMSHTNLTVHRFDDRPFFPLERLPRWLSKPLALINFFLQPRRRLAVLRQRLRSGYDMVLFETMEDVLLLAYMDRADFAMTAVRIHGTEETEGFVYKKDMISWIRRTVLRRVVFKKLRYIVSTTAYYHDFVKKHYLDANPFAAADKEFFLLPNTLGDISDEEEIVQAEDRVAVLTLGRMNEDGCRQKGFNDLLNALLLMDPRLRKRMEVLFVGDGECRERLRKKAEANDMEVRFVASMPNRQLLARLRRNDVVILLSRFEGQSMFALEALAYGNILLCSRTGGVTELIDGNGYLVAPQAPEEVAEKLTEILSLAPRKRQEMKKRSAMLYRNFFGAERTAKRFADLLRIIQSDRNAA